MLFERTIKSICNQTSSNFKVIVVCNEKPNIDFKHPALNYLEVDFKPPGSDLSEKALDKGLKVLEGLLWAQKSPPSFSMVVDADDCISRRLVEFSEQRPYSNGWFFETGYMYPDQSRFVYYSRENFHNLCGTSSIINYKLYEFNYPNARKDVAFIRHYYGNHKYILRRIIGQGYNLEPLPFPGSVYILDNGENFYNQSFSIFVPKDIVDRIKSLKNYRPISQKLRQEMSLHPLRQDF